MGCGNMVWTGHAQRGRGEPWFLATGLAVALAVSVNAAELGSGKSPATLKALIQRAGNADDDTARLAVLRQLQKHPGLDKSLKADAERLVAEIDRWVHEKHLPYFGREAGRTKDYDFKIAEGSPLYPLTYLYRGRMLTWVTLESGSIWAQPKRRREFLDKARGFFERAAKAFPENRIARMYLGEPIRTRKRYPTVPGAPAWAIHQREGLERLADIIEWWIDHRMQPDGQYGGGWGDDCEMWRFWVPVLIGFDSPKISKAQARFSEALMSQPHMKLGYTTRMSDVEHTAEDSADVMTPMMHIDPDNDVWRQRALRLAELTRTRWTGKNERGFLQFKSTYFTATQVDATPQRACDTVYHPRTLQPTLLYWQRTADKKLTELFAAWMDTWVDAAARAERGKPAGILPSAIHWPDGKVGGLGPDWWDPRNHGEYTLYLWPSAMGLMTHTLLLTHHMTGQAKYLEPIRSMARARLKYLKSPPKTPPAPGTEAWCAAKLGGLTSVIAKHKFLTGSTEFNELLAKEMSPYMRMRLHGDRQPLTAALRSNTQALRVNFEGYTSEVRWTDRVLRFPALFGQNGMRPNPIGNFHTPSPSLLYSTATGDPGSAGYFPLNAVRWLTPPRNLAALVTDSGTDRFAAELFHFGENKRPLSAELYLLAPGDYTLTLVAKSDARQTPIATQPITAKGPRTRMTFALPPRELCLLRIRRP